MAMNSFNEYVTRLVGLLNDATSLPLGNTDPLPAPTIAADAPRVLIFSPHPDDEVIMGGLPLRLMRESGWLVINVAVTQGSNKERQSPRWTELERCCAHVGFELVQTIPNGLCHINQPGAKESGPEWQAAVDRIAELLQEHQPRLILFPHYSDWNSTHIGTNLLLNEALRECSDAIRPHVCETEFWGQMHDPNLVVESSATEVGDLITALSFHVGEVERNPYHITLPATMIDNTRRGAELVGGQGKNGPKMQFATLYRHSRWTGSELERIDADLPFICSSEDPASRFPT